MGEFSRIYKSDLTDRQLMAFWDMACASGNARGIGFSGPPLDGAGFVRWMRKPDVYPWIVLFRDDPIALFFLDGVEGKKADGHFLTLGTNPTRVDTPAGRLPVKVAAGWYFIGSALWERNAAGCFIIDTIIGLSPANRRSSLRYEQRLGGRQCGVYPSAFFFWDTNENVDGIIFYWTRDIMPQWAAKI
jgi:hypothetical protein